MLAAVQKESLRCYYRVMVEGTILSPNYPPKLLAAP